MKHSPRQVERRRQHVLGRHDLDNVERAGAVSTYSAVMALTSSMITRRERSRGAGSTYSAVMASTPSNASPPPLSAAAALTQAPPLPLRRRRRALGAWRGHRRRVRASAACAADAGRGRASESSCGNKRRGAAAGRRDSASRPCEVRTGLAEWCAAAQAELASLCDEIARAARLTRPPLPSCRDERVGVEGRQQHRGLAARDDVRRKVAAPMRSRQRENAAALLVGLAEGLRADASEASPTRETWHARAVARAAQVLAHASSTARQPSSRRGAA